MNRKIIIKLLLLSFSLSVFSMSRPAPYFVLGSIGFIETEEHCFVFIKKRNPEKPYELSRILFASGDWSTIDFETKVIRHESKKGILSTLDSMVPINMQSGIKDIVNEVDKGNVVCLQIKLSDLGGRKISEAAFEFYNTGNKSGEWHSNIAWAYIGE